MAIGSFIVRDPRLGRSNLLFDPESAFDVLQRALFAPSTRNAASTAEPSALESRSAFAPLLEAVEEETVYRVRAELPGVEEKDIEVLVEDGVLTLKATRHAEEGDGATQWRSVTHGTFERRIQMPSEVDEENVKAAYRNGVLTITLPKHVEAKPEPRAIPVQVV